MDRGYQGRIVLRPFRALCGGDLQWAMGIDQALKVQAVVVDLLPSEIVRVKLENQDLVLAHATSATKANFMRLRPGDRVEVELSAQDQTRGRILRLVR